MPSTLPTSPTPPAGAPSGDSTHPAGRLPEPVERLLESALVAELTVVSGDGRPVTYPLIPLYDGERVYMTSSTLFSRKLEHIKANPRVCVSLTDPVAMDGQAGRATIQGDARIVEEDPHGGWERLLPLWERKEPSIVAFLKARVALPLFFERALIEIVPRRLYFWPDGKTNRPPHVFDLAPGLGGSSVSTASGGPDGTPAGASAGRAAAPSGGAPVRGIVRTSPEDLIAYGGALTDTMATPPGTPPVDAPGDATKRDPTPGGTATSILAARAAAPRAETPRSATRLEPGDALRKLAGYPFQILTWVGEDGYPLNVALEADVRPDEDVATFRSPAGLPAPRGPVALTGSHIRPQPGYGYDERRHVTAWGEVARSGKRLSLRPTRAWGWDEQEMSFFEYSERSVPQSRRYFASLSAERGAAIRPRLQRTWLFLRATRLPFLSATFAPVLVGIAVAARQGSFDLLTAVITVIAGASVHLGLNVANDIFDTLQGADDANVTPTKFSGGSRVLQYGLLSLREMTWIAFVCYALAGVLGLALLALRGSITLIVIAAIGFFISLAYTAPPLKFVYRGLGEIATAVGFGPVMVLGAYVVQTRGALDLAARSGWEPIIASVPIALLVAMILYVNEIPDRRGDASAGKRTLPVRWSKHAVILGWDVSAGGAFVVTVAGVLLGLLPVTALIVLVAVPLALQTHQGLVEFYDQPYALMAPMQSNINLHLAVGALLFAAYVVAIIAQGLFGTSLLLW